MELIFKSVLWTRKGMSGRKVMELWRKQYYNVAMLVTGRGLLLVYGVGCRDPILII